MNLDIPEGATVQIFIGTPHPIVASPDAVPALPAPRPARGRTLLKGGAIGGLALVAFLVGQSTASRRPLMEVASNASVPPASARPALGRPDVAFPAAPLPRPPAAQTADAPDQIQQAFARQLQQPPSITPPPGSPPPGAPTSAAKPFGLED